MNVDLDAVKSVAIYVLGLVSVIIGALPQVSVSPGVHTALVAIGGVVVAVERYLQGSATNAAKARAGA